MLQQQTFLDPAVLEGLDSTALGELMSVLEGLVSPDLHDRREGLVALVAMDAHRRSSLAAAVLAGQIREPDITLRTAIVGALADLFILESREQVPPDRVTAAAGNVLSAMRTREIYALLQVIVHDAEQLDPVCRLLRTCSFSGETMLAIVKDRQAMIEIRVAAVQAIATIGFLDAKPSFEVLYLRISGQKAGQIPMAFAERVEAEVEALLPALRRAIQILEEAED